MTDDGELYVRAKVMVAGHALVTVHATPRVPADANALSDLAPFRTRTHGGDVTNDFVAENRRVLRNAPFVVQHGKIGVTQATVLDGDFHFFVTAWSEVNDFAGQWLLRRLGDPSVIIRCSSCCASCPGTADRLIAGVCSRGMHNQSPVLVC
jgi:hypothetical protein